MCPTWWCGGDGSRFVVTCAQLTAPLLACSPVGGALARVREPGPVAAVGARRPDRGSVQTGAAGARLSGEFLRIRCSETGREQYTNKRIRSTRNCAASPTVQEMDVSFSFGVHCFCAICFHSHVNVLVVRLVGFGCFVRERTAEAKHPHWELHGGDRSAQKAHRDSEARNQSSLQVQGKRTFSFVSADFVSHSDLRKPGGPAKKM